MDILRHGSEVEVVSPTQLRKRVADLSNNLRAIHQMPLKRWQIFQSPGIGHRRLTGGMEVEPLLSGYSGNNINWLPEVVVFSGVPMR